MKIEKLSENQIRCTLNTSDLRDRHINILELAYGNEKARALFREMIERAGEEVGFQTDDLPLMIEAVPIAGDSIMLIITKVEDPEELDTRFARFAPAVEAAADEAPIGDRPVPFSGSAEDILEAMHRLLEGEKSSTPAEKQDAARRMVSIYRFASLDEIMRAAHALRGLYHGNNSLYFNRQDDRFYLTANCSDHSIEEFNRVCNLLTEYGERLPGSPASEEYYAEHYEIMVDSTALQNLAV